MDDPLADAILDPSAYVERVCLATGEPIPGPIDPAELLVSGHREHHPVETYTRAVAGWVIGHTGREELVHGALREVQRLGFATADGLASALGRTDAASLAERLFGLRHQEHYFRFRSHDLHRAEVRTRLARLAHEATRQLERARGHDGRLRLRVLLTGGTGFVGKELLAQAASDPAIEELYAVVRPGRERLSDSTERAVSPAERGAQLLAQLGLAGTPEAEKIRFVAGDVLLPGFGISQAERARIEERLTHTVHCAASVAFDDPYDVSFRANVLGCRNALLLAEELQQRAPGFVAHIAIETSYIHGRQRLPREEAFVFPRQHYNNYYELTKAFASIETERAVLELGLRAIQLCPSIVVGSARTGNNRGDTKVVNAPVNAFGRVAEALRDASAGTGNVAERARAWMLGRIGQVFPGDAGAELNLVPVDRVVSGILRALRRPEAVGERIHLATDDRISAQRMTAIVGEELGVQVRLAEPTFHRHVELPLLASALRGLGQEKVASALEKLGAIFGGYSERGQPAHEVGSDVELLGLPAERPRTEAVFRMVCRHNRYVQRFGRVRDLDEVARRERAWELALEAIEERLGQPPSELSPEAFRHAIDCELDLETFAPRAAASVAPPVSLTRELFTPADAAWLHMDHPTNLMQITGLLVLEERIELGPLYDLVRRGLLRYDRFRMRVFDVPVGPPRWETDPAFDLARHVERAAIEPGEGALRRAVGALMSTPLARDRPLWHFHVLDQPGAGSSIVVRLHHAIADGIALMRVLLSLTEPADAREAASGPARPAAPEAAPAPAGLLASTRALASRLFVAGQEAILHPRRLVALARAPVAAAGELAHLLGLPADPATPLRGPLGVAKSVAWTPPIPLDHVRAVKRRVSGTINDVLLTALAGGLGRYLEGRGHAVTEDLEVRAVVPVDLRRRRDPPLGNRFGLVFLGLPVGIACPRTRLAELKRRMDALKRSPEAAVAFSVLSALGAAPAVVEGLAVDLLGRKATAVVTNVPGPREARRLAGVRLVDLLFWVPQSGRLGLGVSIFSYDGHVRMSVACDAGLIPDPSALVTALMASFEELRALPDA